MRLLSTPFKKVSRACGGGAWGKLDFFVLNRSGGPGSGAESESDSSLLL